MEMGAVRGPVPDSEIVEGRLENVEGNRGERDWIDNESGNDEASWEDGPATCWCIVGQEKGQATRPQMYPNSAWLVTRI